MRSRHLISNTKYVVGWGVVFPTVKIRHQELNWELNKRCEISSGNAYWSRLWVKSITISIPQWPCEPLISLVIYTWRHIWRALSRIWIYISAIDQVFRISNGWVNVMSLLIALPKWTHYSLYDKRMCWKFRRSSLSLIFVLYVVALPTWEQL